MLGSADIGGLLFGRASEVPGSVTATPTLAHRSNCCLEDDLSSCKRSAAFSGWFWMVVERSGGIHRRGAESATQRTSDQLIVCTSSEGVTPWL